MFSLRTEYLCRSFPFIKFALAVGQDGRLLSSLLLTYTPDLASGAGQGSKITLPPGSRRGNDAGSAGRCDARKTFWRRFVLALRVCDRERGTKITRRKTETEGTSYNRVHILRTVHQVASLPWTVARYLRHNNTGQPLCPSTLYAKTAPAARRRWLVLDSRDGPLHANPRQASRPRKGP